MSQIKQHIERAIRCCDPKGKQAGLAKACGVSQGMVSHWLTGRQQVTWEQAKNIEAATGGVVTRHDLRPDIYGPKPEHAA